MCVCTGKGGTCVCVQGHSLNYRDITPVSVKGVIVDFQPSFAETAINIGYSCKLLQEDMEVRCIAGEDSEVIRGELETVIAMHQHSTNRQSSKDSVQSQDVSMVCIRTYVQSTALSQNTHDPTVHTYDTVLCYATSIRSMLNVLPLCFMVHT